LAAALLAAALVVAAVVRRRGGVAPLVDVAPAALAVVALVQAVASRPAPKVGGGAAPCRCCSRPRHPLPCAGPHLAAWLAGSAARLDAAAATAWATVGGAAASRC
jgi:hypothetical protein